MEPSVLLTLDGGWGRLVSIFCFRQNAVAFFCEEASGRARREIKHCAHSFCCSRFCCAAARRGGLFGLVAPVFMELRAFGPPPFVRNGHACSPTGKAAVFPRNITQFLTTFHLQAHTFGAKSGSRLDEMIGIGCRRLSFRACARGYVSVPRYATCAGSSRASLAASIACPAACQTRVDQTRWGSSLYGSHDL